MIMAKQYTDYTVILWHKVPGHFLVLRRLLETRSALLLSAHVPISALNA